MKTYEEAVGKKIPGNYLVTLSKKDGEKAMITLFLLERARTLPAEERQKTMNLLELIKQLQKTSVKEVNNITSETFNIDRTTLDKLIVDLENKGKIKRIDENFVKIT